MPPLYGFNAYAARNGGMELRRGGGGGGVTTPPVVPGTTPPGPGFPPGGPFGGQNGGPYYIPGFNYGSQIPGAENSDLANYLQKQNWQIAYDYWSRGQGLAPNGAYAQFVRSQEPLLQRGFNTAMLSNPDLTPQQFLGQYSGNLQDQFQALPYQQRGENPSQWGQGRQQWVMRRN